jgi:DNA-binding transcriptional MocR family regulator
VLTLWRDPVVERRIADAGALYAERRAGLLDALGRHGVRAHGASGLNVWVPVTEETGVVGALLQRGWVVAPGAPYRLADSPPAIRVTTATLRDGEAGRLAGDIAGVLAGAGASRSG